MQEGRLCAEAGRTGLPINTKETKEMHISSPVPDALYIGGLEIEWATAFTYLGSKVTEQGDEDVGSCIGKASGVVCKKQKWIGHILYKCVRAIEK